MCLMPNINHWLGSSMPLGEWRDDWDRGVDTARIIADKPTTLSSAIITSIDGRVVSDQTVRIEALSDFAARQMTPASDVAALKVMVLGYKGHPSIDDTDLKRGDRFLSEGTLFEIILIQPGHTDRLIAIAEARK
jgi:hypothetical protein